MHVFELLNKKKRTVKHFVFCLLFNNKITFPFIRKQVKITSTK